MSSVQHLREFIRERLTAAVEEIFTEFDKTIVLFEKEIDRHRRLLDTCKKKAQRNFHTAATPQQHVYKAEDVLMDQHLFNQERDCSVDHAELEPQLIKDIQIKFWTRQEVEHNLLKKDNDSFSMRQCKSSCEEAFGVSKSSILEENLDGQRQLALINLNKSELPQEHMTEEDDLQDNQHVWGRNSTLDQEVQTRVLQQNKEVQEKPEPPQIKKKQGEPESLQIKEEPEEFCSSQDEEQAVLMHDINVLVINYDDECDSIKSGPTSTQLLSHSSASSPSRGESSLDADETKPYVFNSCGKRFSDLTSVNCHQKEKPFSCEMCMKSFGQRHSMLRHMITHTGERPYSCQTCGDKFGLKSHLLRHMRTHTGEKPFTCEICHKSFTQSNSLTYHMRIHTDERPHSCKECGKSFKQTGALKTHLRTHTNEKPYSCNVCGKSLRSSTSLMCHMRTHTGEKPYSCKICGRGFTQTGALNVHLRTHTNEKPYSCNVCGKCLRTKTSLQYHIRTHTGEKPYSCKICAKRFSQSSHLFLHMKSSHR